MARIERLTRALRIESQPARMKATFRYDVRGFVEDVLRTEEALGVQGR